MFGCCPLLRPREAWMSPWPLHRPPCHPPHPTPHPRRRLSRPCLASQFAAPGCPSTRARCGLRAHQHACAHSSDTRTHVPTWIRPLAPTSGLPTFRRVRRARGIAMLADGSGVPRKRVHLPPSRNQWCVASCGPGDRDDYVATGLQRRERLALDPLLTRERSVRSQSSPPRGFRKRSRPTR